MGWDMGSLIWDATKQALCVLLLRSASLRHVDKYLESCTSGSSVGYSTWLLRVLENRFDTAV